MGTTATPSQVPLNLEQTAAKAYALASCCIFVHTEYIAVLSPESDIRELIATVTIRHNFYIGLIFGSQLSIPRPDV